MKVTSKGFFLCNYFVKSQGTFFCSLFHKTIKIVMVRKYLCLKTTVCYFGLIRKVSKIVPPNP